MYCTDAYGCGYAGIDHEWDTRDSLFTNDLQFDRAKMTADEWVAAVNAAEDAYIATITDDERRRLVSNIAEYLGDDWWQGLIADPQEVEAVAFMLRSERYAAGQLSAAEVLTPAFLAEYRTDVAGELRLGRGWCPHDGDDKWAYGTAPLPPVETRELG